jgi:hypothetical protein
MVPPIGDPTWSNQSGSSPGPDWDSSVKAPFRCWGHEAYWLRDGGKMQEIQRMLLLDCWTSGIQMPINAPVLGQDFIVFWTRIGEPHVSKRWLSRIRPPEWWYIRYLLKIAPHYYVIYGKLWIIVLLSKNLLLYGMANYHNRCITIYIDLL